MSEQHIRVPKPIGELNGKWAVLFKVANVLIVLMCATFLPWAVYVTQSLNDHNTRLTLVEQWRKDAPSLIKSEVNAELGEKMFLRLDSLVAEIASLRTSVVRLETQVSTLQMQLEKRSASAQIPYYTDPADRDRLWAIMNEKTNNAVGHR